MVPHLVTAASGPIPELEKRLLDATPSIERWLRLEWQEHTPPFYASVDLRNAGFKLAPLETSLFPAGINHLADDTLPLAVQAAMAAIEKYCADARHLLLIPDEPALGHADYLGNILRLASILRQTGLEVRFGYWDTSQAGVRTLNLPDGRSLVLEPVLRSRNRIGLKDFDPCAILVNTAMAQGTPAWLQGLEGQVLLPPLHAGWAVRRRSKSAAAYQDVSKRFAKMLGIEPWVIAPVHTSFQTQGLPGPRVLAGLQESVEHVLKQIRTKYKAYGVSSEPFVIIKPDAGPGPNWVIRESAELADLSHAPSGSTTEHTGWFIQEGVPTIEKLDQGIVEPVVYTMDRYVVGGYYRLDSDGTRFKPLPFAAGCNTPDCVAQAKTNRFYAYGVIARLALLAASIELERSDPDQALHGN